MPIAIGSDHLDIAIPSQWRDQEWQHLIDQLPDQHRTIRLHPAIEADLQRPWQQKQTSQRRNQTRLLQNSRATLLRQSPKALSM